jgi:uncharacterized protein (TIGR03435 family)
MKRLLSVLGFAILATSAPLGQEASPRPVFDAVSIRPIDSLGGGTTILTVGGLNAPNVPVEALITIGYGLKSYQLVGGPEWIRTARFNVMGRSDANPPFPQLQLMMQAMLAERFRLVAHKEQRDLPGYRLVVAREGRLGLDLKPGADCSLRGERPGGPCRITYGAGTRALRGMTIQQFADGLVSVVGGVVVDRTNLPGIYDIDLRWTPEFERQAGDPAAAPIATDAPNIFTAIQEQLGLKLEPGRVPTEVLVVDSVERPTEN